MAILNKIIFLFIFIYMLYIKQEGNKEKKNRFNELKKKIFLFFLL